MMLAAVALNAFLAAFSGTWECTPHVRGVVAAPTTTWHVDADPGTPWTVVRWESRGASGTAYVGYVAAQAQWIYEDFRSDGGFGTYTSAGPQNGAWTWSGTFATPQRVRHGAMRWRRERDGFRQSIGRMLGTSFREVGAATCRRAS